MTDEFANLGWLPSPPDDRDWPLAGAIADNPTPTERAYKAPVTLPNANQFRQDSTHSACVAYSGCNTRIATEQLFDDESLLFAQLELYRRCKEIDGLNAPGTYIRVAAQIMVDRGAAVGVIPAGRVGGLADPVSPAQYRPISGYVRVDQTQLTEIKKAIYYLGHAWLAIRWYANWNPSAGNVTATNPVLPKPGTYTTGHGIDVYAWNDDLVTWAGKGGLRFKNSFGQNWGDNGDGVIPYQILPTIIREAWATFDLEETPDPPSSGNEETPMPDLAEYLPGYTAIVDDDANIRETPTTAGAVIRKTAGTTEVWTIVGTVKGDATSGSDRWYARWNAGRWEYTHSTNVPTAPQPPGDSAALAVAVELADARRQSLDQIKTVLEAAP